jgi:hypothetical protein
MPAAPVREASTAPKALQPRRQPDPFGPQPEWILRFIAEYQKYQRAGFFGRVHHHRGHVPPRADRSDGARETGLQRRLHAHERLGPGRHIGRVIGHGLQNHLDQVLCRLHGALQRAAAHSRLQIERGAYFREQDLQRPWNIQRPDVGAIGGACRVRRRSRTLLRGRARCAICGRAERRHFADVHLRRTIITAASTD